MADINTFDTYRSVGIREDLIDVIYDISPTDTPFVSNVGSGSSKGTFHEWQTDALEDPITDDSEGGRVAEGADADLAIIDATVRLGNYCQINSKAWAISGTDLVADNAGRGVEMAYQEAKKGLELRRDIESVAVGTLQIGSTGSGNNPGPAVGRTAGAVPSWLGTNTSTGGGLGADPTNQGLSGWTARVDGDLRNYTEDLLEGVIDQIYLAGGNPDTIMLNTQLKREQNSFTGVATEKNIMTPDKRIINAVDFYESDYNVLAIVPNRWMRQRDVFVLDTDMWEISYHRPFMTWDLAKTGDNEKKQMVVEWTVTSKEEKSSGGVFDVQPAP